MNGIVKTLFDGLDFSDPTVFKHKGKWWLFAETDPKGYSTLRLYFADDLLGPWKEHPQSPIVEYDENIARPAGRLVVFEDNLLRFAQDCSPTYGNQVRAFQIHKLTTSEYIEQEHPNSPILESSRGYDKKGKLPNWRSEGMHHIDAHQISEEKWIACVDGITRTVTSKQWVLKIRIPFTEK